LELRRDHPQRSSPPPGPQLRRLPGRRTGKMMNRYCTRCAADVGDTDGFCLLGHPLTLQASSAPLANLRAEVDSAFADARVQAAWRASAPGVDPGPSVSAQRAATRKLAPPAIAAASGGRPPPPPPPALHAPADPIAAFAPPPRMDWGPERSIWSSMRFRMARRPHPVDA